MPTVAESINAQSPLNAALEAGVRTLSRSQTVTFSLYQRQVLPADGFIFWLNTGKRVEFEGSLHYATRTDQREDETIAVNSVIFTALQEIKDLNDAAPDTTWIATLENGVRFSFGTRGSFYEQAGLYHYRGDAVYPTMATQIVDNVADLDLDNRVVSNSLPLWLTLNALMPMYPSYLVPDNLVPPYASVHIVPDSTQAIQSAPSFDANLTHSQLARERVRITLYGSRNTNALDFQDYLFQHSLDTDDFGVMNMPIIRDEKKTQSELSILATKKSIEFEVSYYQSRVNAVSRKFILSAVASYFPNPL